MYITYVPAYEYRRHENDNDFLIWGSEILPQIVIIRAGAQADRGIKWPRVRGKRTVLHGSDDWAEGHIMPSSLLIGLQHIC